MGVRGTFKGGVKDNGLILHYDAGKVDSYNRAGLVVNDLSESKTTGGLTSSTIRWSDSNRGIIIFDGTSTKINIGAPSNLQFINTQPFTISVWFKWTEASAAVGNLVAYVTTPPSATGWYVGLDRSGAIGTNVAFFDFAANSGSYRGIFTANNSIIQNAWMNIVATNDSSNTVAGMKIYINGTLSSTTNRGSASPATPNYTGIIAQVGARASDASYNFEGNISQVMIYNRELTAAEILQNYTNFRSRISIRGIDSDTDDFLKAAHIEDATQAVAINNLVLDLKKFGLWTKMKAIYPIVGGNAWSHKFNLKDPRDADSAYRLFFSGSWTHGSTGMTPSSAYANTYFIPVNNSSLNSSHVSFYSRTNSDGGSGAYTSYVDIGGSNQLGSAGGTGLALRTSDIFSGRVDVYPNLASDAATASNTDSRGFYIASRTSSTSTKIYKNGLIVGSNSTAGNRSTKSLLISADNKDNPDQIVRYSNRQSAFITIGDGLTDTESANFYTAVQAFQTMLGRQV